MHPTVVVTVSLMPMLLCALDAALSTRQASRIAAAAAVLTLQLLGGHHQFTFYSLLLAVAYALVLVPRPQRDGGTHRSITFFHGGVFLAVILLAVGICALPLAATFEMRSLTLRQALPQESLVTSFALPIENLMLFLLPHLLGTVSNYTGRSLLWESCGYVTILPFLAGLAALAARPRHRELWFWTGVVFVSLALAIVDGNPLYKILPHVPVFNWFRAPARYLVLTTFALAMCLAHGFAVLTSLATPEARVQTEVEGNGASGAAPLRAVRVLGGVLLLLLMMAVMANIVFCNGQSVLWNGLSAGAAFYHPVRTRADVIFNSLAGWDGVFLFAHIMIGGGILLLLLKQRVRRHWAAGVLAFLVCSDLLRVAHTMKDRIDPAYFAYEPATATFIKRQPGLFRVWTGDCDLDTARKDPALSALPAAFVEKNFLRPDLNVFFGLSHADVIVGLDLLRSSNLLRSLALPPEGAFLSGTDEISKTPIVLRGANGPLRARLMSLLNVRYAVTTGRFDVEGWHQVFPTDTDTSDVSAGGVRVWQNRDVLPRAFLVGAAQFATPQTALQTLLSDSFDPSRAAVLEDKTLVTLPSEPPPGFMGRVQVQSYGDTQMMLETQCARPSLLVISDTWYPGWRAWVDGVETPLLRADYALRGIALPAGRHHVVCAYRPRWWWPAIAISILTLLLTTSLLASTLRRKAASRETP